MPDITKHPQYEEHKNTWIKHKATAEAANDELGKMRADSEWNSAQLFMTNELSNQEEQARAHQEAVARVRAAYPQVPEATVTALASQVKDPAALESSVKQIADSLPPVTNNTPPPAVSGTTTPGGGQPNRQRTDNPFDDPKQAREIARTARTKAGFTEGKEAIESIQKETFMTKILPEMAAQGSRYAVNRAEGRKRAGYDK